MQSEEEKKEEKMILMDGYNDCIVGFVEQFGRPSIVCYDKSLIIQRLMSDGMSQEDAEEYFEYNQIGAYVGEFTPCFLTLASLEDILDWNVLQ